jgi:aspartate aminotransferase
MTGHPPLSPMLDRLRESATIGITRRARELRDSGRDVLVISGGEPDFDTPDHIKQAAFAAISAGQTKYTATDGTAELKQAVARKFNRDNGLDFPLNGIVIGTGAKQLIFNALMATVAAGDEVVIPTPSWVSYPDIVELLGGRPVLLECSRAAGFKLTPERLRSAITPQTQWLILNSPCNPSGAVYNAAELRGLAKVLLDFPHVLVMSDDIYEYIVFEDTEFATISAVEPRLQDRTLIINGVSKAHCMTGWRIGFSAGPAWLAKAMVTLQGQETNGPSSISQAAAVAALDGPLDHVEANNIAYKRRRDLVVERVNAIPGLSCDPPQGTFYVYVDVSGLIGRRTPQGSTLSTDIDVADYLLAEGGVALVPGTGFNASPFARLCFAYSDDVVADACDRIASACAKLHN